MLVVVLFGFFFFFSAVFYPVSFVVCGGLIAKKEGQ